jgi:hypothetical protein
MPTMRNKAIYIPTMKDVLRMHHTVDSPPMNSGAHDRLHAPMIFIYNTSSTLDTTAGPGLRLPRGGELTRIAGRVTGAPTGDMSIDVLAGGTTIFGGGYLKIPSGEKITKEKIVERPMFSEDTVFTVQINTINSATGPLVLTFEFLPEY